MATYAIRTDDNAIHAHSFSDDGLFTEVWTDVHRLMSEATDSQNLDIKEAER